MRINERRIKMSKEINMDKTLFIHNELQTLLKKVNLNISKVEFMETDTGEYVIVTIIMVIAQDQILLGRI